MAERIHPVILSGGSGTRLWPLSRAALPKQLLPLAGEQTMIQATALRVASAAPPVIICSEDHRFIVAEQMQAVGIARAALVLEPMGRNTAPAAAIAALIAGADVPDAIVALLPSDHVIADTVAFHDALAKAADAAARGFIVTFGIAPTRPETGYGYIQRGAALDGVRGAFHVRRFTEKPDTVSAAAFLASGDYSWNGGMFVFRASVLLAELERHAPDVVQACRAALNAGERSRDFIRLQAEAFAKAPNISIDYAVMEKTDKAAVVPCSLGWNDVGAWSSLWDIKPRDADGNVFEGDVLAHDTRDSLVRSDRRLTALVGVKDIVVVTTEDAVLVSSRSASQDVKAIVDRLKADKRYEATEGKTVSRPWGTYRSIDDGARFQVKQIVVKPGGRLSLQMHHKRAEHWIVVEGTARVTRDDEVFDLQENQSTFIPLGAKHRLENPGTVPLRLIEVQCGSYLGEDDIVRFEDVYGRAAKA